MIDLDLIRKQPELVKDAIKNKGETFDLNAFLALDRERVNLLNEAEELRFERNQISSSIIGKPPPDVVKQARKLRDELSKLEEVIDGITREFNSQYKKIPNIPTNDTPIGFSEDQNEIVCEWGSTNRISFPALNHYEIALHNGWIDKERAAKVAGSRFAYIKGALVKMQFALIEFVMRKLTDENFIAQVAQDANLQVSAKPFTPILPPYMIRTSVYDAMDRLEPRNERYKIDNTDLWLQGSAEHVLGSMYINEIIQESEFPIRYLGYATSFRSEAGAAGKDLEGIIRLHQFDKLEMEGFSTHETSHDEHLLFSAIQERLMQLLNVPYRKLQKCTYDIGKPNAKGSDIEAWLPGQKKYRETHTADYMTDYQARRLNTRVRRANGDVEFVHTNDATAFACGRAMVAIIENYQNEDMTVNIPEVLRAYLDNKKLLNEL